jgi:hypothetical protein
MCRLLNSKNENVLGMSCEYLNTLFGVNLRNFRFQIVDWAVPDIQIECQKLTLKEGYHYFKLQICGKVTCDNGIREDVESRYFGIQTEISEEESKEMLHKIVLFHEKEDNQHQLCMCMSQPIPIIV